MKPDVLKQIKVLEAEREEMMKKHMAENGGNGGGQILMQKPGGDPIPMTQQDILNLIQQQQNENKDLTEKLNALSQLPHHAELDKRQRKIDMLEKLVERLTEELKTLKNAKTPAKVEAPVVASPQIKQFVLPCKTMPENNTCAPRVALGC